VDFEIEKKIESASFSYIDRLGLLQREGIQKQRSFHNHEKAIVRC